MKHRATGLAALLLIPLLLLGACSKPAGGNAPAPSPSESATPTSTPTPTPTPAPPANELRVGVIRDLNSLDPVYTQADQQITVFRHLYEGLLRYEAADPDQPLSNVRLVPGQAERWERETKGDGTVTYTFTLRDDIFWSDGKPVTAGDFVYAWRRAVDPEISAPKATILMSVQNAPAILAGQQKPEQLGVSAPDDKTFVVTLTDDVSFLEACAYPITVPLRADVVEPKLPAAADPPAAAPASDAPTETPSETPSDQPSASPTPSETPSASPSPSPTPVADPWDTDPDYFVSNGPYVLRSWTRFEDMTLVPNPHYYGGQTGPDAIHFRYSYDTDALVAAFQAGSIDFALQVPADVTETYTTLDKDRVTAVPYAGLYYLSFNANRKPFDDPLVRQAFALAVDREEVAKVMGGVPAAGVIPPAIGASTGDAFRDIVGSFFDADDYEANGARARELLAQAGYPGGEGFPETAFVYNANDTHGAVAKILADCWQQTLGVTVTLANVDWTDYLNGIQGNDYAIAKMSWIATRDDPAEFLSLWAEGTTKWYDGDELHHTLTLADNASSPEGRAMFLREAEQQLLGTDWALAPLFYYTRSCLMAKDLAGLAYSPLGWYQFTQAKRG